MKRMFLIMAVFLCCTKMLNAQVIWDDNYYCVGRGLDLSSSLTDASHWLEKSDSCMTIWWRPGVVTAENERWNPMKFSIDVPLSVTEVKVVSDKYTNCIFFVDSTGYIMIKAQDKDSSSNPDGCLTVDANSLVTGNYKIDTELDLFRHRVGYYAPMYYAVVDCARLVFYNIPKDIVDEMLASLWVQSCLEHYEVKLVD